MTVMGSYANGRARLDVHRPGRVRRNSWSIGIFSLARRSPRMRSRVAGRAAWSVQLGEDHFVGRAPAAVPSGTATTAPT